MAEPKNKYKSLNYGDKGKEVLLLKKALKLEGYDVDISNDDYDYKTTLAVEQYKNDSRTKIPDIDLEYGAGKSMQKLLYESQPSGTRLTEAETKEYETWKAKLPENLQYEGDYDLKGFWKKNPTWTAENKTVHMTDEFKLPNHPTYSTESIYSNEYRPGGKWSKDENGNDVYEHSWYTNNNPKTSDYLKNSKASINFYRPDQSEMSNLVKPLTTYKADTTENVTGNPTIKLGEQMSFSPSSTWNINSELYPNPNAKYIKNSIVSPPPPPNPNTTSTQNNGEVNPNATYANWSSEDLALLMKENPKWRYEGISPFNYKNYSEYKAAKTSSNEEENSKSITDETINAIVKSMGENIKTNERDIKGNRTFNDIITLGEMANNINEPKYEGESIKEPAMMVSERISAKASLDSIDRSKAAAIKQLASVGRQDMIPSVLKEADNKKLEIQQNVGNANAQIINQERQINQQTYNQGIELGMRGSQFDAQMSSQQEQLRGAALSQNLTNLRNSSRDMTNSMTMNSDNKITYDMYIAALNDPEMMKFMQSYYSNIKRIQRETKQ